MTQSVIDKVLVHNSISTLLDALFIIVYLVIMFLYSAKLTLVSLISIPILVCISLMITPFLKQRLDDKFQCGAEQQSNLVEVINPS